MALFVKEEEMNKLKGFLRSVQHERRLVITFYVRKRITSSSIPYYVKQSTNIVKYPAGFYPINTLRDLSIESISTTHYVVIDSDTFVSTTLSEGIQTNQRLLMNHKNVLLLPLFEYNDLPEWDVCLMNNECDELSCLFFVLRRRWRAVPRTKEDVVRMLRQNRIRGKKLPYHVRYRRFSES